MPSAPTTLVALLASVKKATLGMDTLVMPLLTAHLAPMESAMIMLTVLQLLAEFTVFAKVVTRVMVKLVQMLMSALVQVEKICAQVTPTVRTL